MKIYKRHKVPGLDGIPTDFFHTAWDTIQANLLRLVNDMFCADSLPALRTWGVVVCIPKIPRPIFVTDYRFLTLLNTDLKIFARILAHRLKPWLSSLLHPTQYGGVGNNILDALATIRDSIADAEFSQHPVCLLSIDFRETFDKVAHSYLFHVFDKYSSAPQMTNAIRNLYSEVAAVEQINSFITQAIPVGRSVRHGCPLRTLVCGLS
jgi:hypothetical protein